MSIGEFPALVRQDDWEDAAEMQAHKRKPGLQVSDCFARFSRLPVIQQRANMELHRVKLQVKMALPSTIPMTVSISARDALLCCWQYSRKSLYDLPIFAAGTASSFRLLLGLNQTILGKSRHY